MRRPNSTSSSKAREHVRAAAGRSKNPARRSLNVGREGAGEDAYGKAPSDRDMVGAVARGLQDSHVAAESRLTQLRGSN
jgi:hypothetical protein